jgi:regulator of protease activity HflC (stomatin/prohibitin superfamily)
MEMENKNVEERKARYFSGMVMFILMILIAVLSAFLVVWAVGGTIFGLYVNAGPILWLPTAICWVAINFIIIGLHILKPNEAYVFTIFGKYHGSIKEAGFYYVNPFAIPTTLNSEDTGFTITSGGSTIWKPAIRKVSLKATTLNNEKQKINDQLGNPIEIGIVVIWRVINTAKAVFNVDNYSQYLSTQCDSALRNIVRMYPYDIHGNDNEKTEDADELSLRGSSREIAEQIRTEIQEKVDVAGLEVMEARITHLAYSPEIAAAMLQRQQASAIIDARALIVRGAVSMVEQALKELSENDIVDLDNERKAAMVSNLLVVLCGESEVHPVVNAGTLYS